MRVFAVRTLVLACCSVSLATLAAAPQGGQAAQGTPTFRSLSDLVQVDVVAVDKDGNQVRGLKASDFTLLDRKKPQTIAAFEEVTHKHPGEDADVPAAPALPAGVKRDVASNQTAQSDRLVVMVVDDLHIYRNRTDRTRDIARTVVNDLGTRASMAVLFTSGEHSIEVTEDRTELLAVINQLTARRPYPRPIVARDDLHGLGPDPGLSDIKEHYDDMNAYKTVEDAARMLGASDGRRKAFVFISEGYGKDLSGIFDAMRGPGDAPEGGDAYAASGDATATIGGGMIPPYHEIALMSMMESMRKSNVTTYAIDPRGLVSSQDLMKECHPAIGKLEDPCLGGGLPAWNSWVRQAQHGLELTAKASGGFAITNTDDFTGGLKRIIDDLDHYYLLGFYPANPGTKGYRTLDAQVNRPDVTLRFRRGYDAGGPPAPPKNKDPLVALSAGVMPQTDLPLRLTATVLPGLPPALGSKPGGKLEARVAIGLEVTAYRRELMGADRKVGASLRYSVLAADLKSGKIARQFTNTAELMSGGVPAGDIIAFQCPIELTLPPGRYQLRASATSEKLGKGGSVYLAIDVPDFSAGTLTVSGLAVGYSNGERVIVAAPRAAAGTKPALPFSPSLDRDFDANDTLRLYFEIARANRGAMVQTRAEVIGHGDAILESVDRVVPPNDDGRVDLRVPLAGLAAGAYRLRVTAVAGQSTATREIGFVVR